MNNFQIEQIHSFRTHHKDIHSAAKFVRFHRPELEQLFGKRSVQALVRWHDRQKRVEHPDGSFDNAGRFYPSGGERCICCRYVREPSRAWPNSYMLHCRSLEHVCELTGANPDDVQSVAYAAIRLYVMHRPGRSANDEPHSGGACNRAGFTAV